MTDSNNKRAQEQLGKIFSLWSDISKDEDGDELRQPASEDEVRKSREILNKISQMDISNKELIQRYKELNEIIA